MARNGIHRNNENCLCRLHEFDEQVAAVREGMARVVPVPLLSLFTGYELETMVSISALLSLSG